MKFHIVENEKRVKQIIEGTERPKNIPHNQTEAKQRARDERWIPEGWKSIESFDDEDEADKRLKELEAKELEAKKSKP